MLPFIPVQGPEKAIQNSDVAQGTLYFTTDTGKILMDVDGKRITLGANGASVFYSSAVNLSVNTDDTYTILKSDLEDSFATPKANDLIINSDGRFFKVNFVEGDNNFQINCRLIAISGTGGGTVGPGGGDSSDPKVIDVFYKDYRSSFLAGTKYDINLTATSKVDTDLTLSYVVINANNRTVDLGSKTIKSGVSTTIEDIGRNISTDGSYHAIIISITGANSRKYELTLTKVRCINLRLEDDPDNFISAKIYPSSINYSLKVFGKISKTLYVEIDGQKIINPILLTENDDNRSKTVTINCEELKLNPGVHTIAAYLEADGVPSNTIRTDFIYHPTTAGDATYIIITKYPERCLSYESPVIEYWVYDTSKTNGYKNSISLYVNGASIDDDVEIVQQEGQINYWTVANLSPEQDNICEISCNGVSNNVSIYCEYSNIFEEVKDAARVLLSATGHTNQTSLAKRQKWEYKNYNNETITANLLNFNWNNNGWMKDSNGVDCLRVSNGASVEIPLHLFEDSKPTSGGFTLEFEFNPHNLYSYNLLTRSTETIEKDDELDDNVEINRTFNADYAAISYIAKAADNSDFGLCCGTQDAFFRMSNGDNATVRYTDEKIVNVAVTINAAKKQICMYINGIMSGMTTYKTAAELPNEADKIVINSQQCDLDLYNIRIYDKVLTSNDIAQNYIASKKDLQIYKENQFSSGDTVNLSALINYNTDNPDNATIPYIIFKTNSAPDILPFNKANEDVICDIEFVNPALDHALNLGLINEEYYKKHAPSFIASGVKLNVQGTSSQKYPRKNFKGKFKNAANNNNWNCTNEIIQDKKLNKFYMTETIAENTITWKADYMDSSSCHNTGFISYAQDLYWNHPLDYLFGTDVGVGTSELGSYRQQYRTTLYGFPVLAFHQKSDGTSEFIGRYNFNLDKSAPSSLGMNLNVAHPYLPDKKIEEVCECWEFANNMGGRCSFRGNPFDYRFNYEKEKYDLYDIAGNLIEGEGKSDIGDDLEVRYHKDKDAIEGAFDNLDAPKDDGGKPLPGGSREAFEILVGDPSTGARTGAYRNLEIVFNWLKDCYFAFDLKTKEDREWVAELLNRDSVTYEDLYDDEGNIKDSEYKTLVNTRKTKFSQEFEKHFNLEYCCIYYIMTELLLQYDSRGKNMMLASWGPVEQNGDYIWFPIFYDVDTQLGVNNSGVPSWEYNVEPTTGFNNPGGKKAFSTANSLLWNNFHKWYVEETSTIKNRYQLLRGRTLTIDKLKGYYNFNYNISNQYCMKGINPINIINANQYYKYIEPSTVGYVTGIADDGSIQLRKTDSYFYCLQGTRELHRDLFLRNRFNYYDSKWMAQDYQPGTGGASMRWRANAHTDTVSSLNGNLVLNIKPALDQYIVIWLDESATYVHPVFARGGEITQIDLSTFMTSSEYQQQLIYIGGYKYLQEYGNVSLLYLDEFEYPIDATKIIKIEMGNENDNYSPNVSYKTDALAIATKEKPLLKIFDITNVNGMSTALTSIDLTDSVKLEEFKALGTSLSTVEFADGVNLQKLYLPNTLTEINLKHAMALNKVIYNKEEIYDTINGVSKQTKPGMYIDNVVASDGTSKIGSINIVGGALKQYSYELLEKITNARANMNNAKLAINMEEVQWSPFTRLGEGAEYNEDYAKDNKYKYATDNAQFITYNYSDLEKWNADLLSDRVYLYEELPIQSATNLSLLDKFINDGKNNFTNITTTGKKDYPIITGSIYINNNSANPIDEAELFNKYSVYFPGLDIKAANITDSYRARFVQLIDGVEKNILTQRVSKTEENAVEVTPPTMNIPVPNHHVFLGWSLTPPTGDYEADAEKVLSNDELKQFKLGLEDGEYVKPEFIFYAIYTKETYTVHFIDTKASPQETSRYDQQLHFIYGEQLTEPELVPYREFEESQLEITERIAFKGWTITESNSGIVSSSEIASNIIIDISKIKADRNYTFYPVYVQENVYDCATDEKYFIFTQQENGSYSISASSNYLLQGKVTIPASYNGSPITIVGRMNALKLVKHVFFYGNSNITTIAAEAFKKNSLDTSYLIGVYLPESVASIGASAFNNQTVLQHICDEYIKDSNNLGAFGQNISSVGEGAFSYCSSLKVYNLSNKMTRIPSDMFYQAGSEIRLTSLPPAIKEVGERAFFNCPSVNIGSFGSNSSEVGGSQLKYIGAQAFMTGSNDLSKIIFIYNSVTTIDYGAFTSYANNNNTTIYTTHTEKPLGWIDKMDMGVADIQYGYNGG